MGKATVKFKAINTPSCGLDVHKDKIDACVIEIDGENETKHHKSFSTMRRSLNELVQWIVSFNCFNVLMESTGVYWIPIYEMLEEVTGMDVGVGNSSHMKQVPGRPKTDKEDASWIARLCMVGFILKSFIVGRPFRELREYTRYHKKLVQDRARQVNRIEKLLQMNGFKLSSVLSDITGVSGMNLLRLLQRKGSVTLAEVRAAINPRVKKTPEEIEQAINGRLKYSSRVLLGAMLRKLDSCDAEIAEIYEMMEELAKEYEPQIRILDSIPGIGRQSAIYIIAEISTDLSSFKNANYLAAWAGLAPKDKESAGKLKSSKTKKANIYYKTILTECAWAAVKRRGTRVSNWYWTRSKKLGQKKAITAVARKLTVYIYTLLENGEMYNDSLDVADTLKREAQKLESAHKIVEHRSKTSAVTKTYVDLEQDKPKPLIKSDADLEPDKPKPLIKSDADLEPDKSKPLKKRGIPRKSPKNTGSGSIGLL